MHRTAPIALVSAMTMTLAACGGPQRGATAEGGCPSAVQLGFAQWAKPDAEGAAPAAWLVRLGYFIAEDGAAASGPMPAYEVAKLGLGPLPPTVWLLRADAVMCQATVTGYVGELVHDGPPSMIISAVLSGCPAGADEYQPAWISLAATEPTGCEVRVPVADGARTGVETETGLEIAPATDATSLPTRWQPFAPEAACEAPCETLWQVSTIAGNPSVHQVLITEVAPGPDACVLEPSDSFGLYATTADGVPHLLRGPEPTDGSEALLSRATLAGALVDPRGTRAVLALGVDDWSAYDLAADGSLGAGRTVRYFEANVEASLHLSLTPYCGP